MKVSASVSAVEAGHAVLDQASLRSYLSVDD